MSYSLARDQYEKMIELLNKKYSKLCKSKWRRGYMDNIVKLSYLMTMTKYMIKNCYVYNNGKQGEKEALERCDKEIKQIVEYLDNQMDNMEE